MGERAGIGRGQPSAPLVRTAAAAASVVWGGWGVPEALQEPN